MACPCGKVLPIVQRLESKVFGIHRLGAQHTDWVQYGKVMPDLFQGSVGCDISLLHTLIHVDKHAGLLGAVKLLSTLAAAAAAVVADLAPALPVAALDEGSIDGTLEMDLDVPVPLSECKRFLGKHPPCSNCGGCTPSWGATTRSCLGKSLTAKGYSP